MNGEKEKEKQPDREQICSRKSMFLKSIIFVHNNKKYIRKEKRHAKKGTIDVPRKLL